MLQKAILKFNYMNNFDKIINECFEILDVIELLIEEKDYMFISNYYRRLSNDIDFLKKNINNKNVITNKRIKDMEALAKRVEDEYNTIQATEKEQQNIYKAYTFGILPKVAELKKYIKVWNFIHKDKKPLKTSIVESKIFNY
jgi:DNA-binding transcriptional regulator GbsR (MarR family)